MDTESGKIVAVEWDGSTWRFNVCTNTWRRGARLPVASFLASPQLVYASGRDRILLYAGGAFAQYSVERDRWTGFGAVNKRVKRAGVYGVAYDRVSKRVLLLGGQATVWSYSPVTKAWARLHKGNEALAPRQWLDWPLMTFDPTRRELIAFSIGRKATWTFSLETRRWTRHDSRPPELVVGWVRSGGELVFDVAADRALAYSYGLLAAFNPDRGRWRRIEVPYGPLFGAPAKPGGAPTGALARTHERMVYDPVNERVVMMGGEIRTRATGERTWQEATDVLAYKYATNRWRKLVRRLR
ncbi:MAG TPA: hypothetical protein VFR87_17640 [Nocardioidaceae bacterium]|nr:hypothetical protein [Nocardioidaceae bacterium]